jgi:hypothetical protein
MVRRLENFVQKYGPEAGPVVYHVLQSQAAHAGVSARLRRKLDVLAGKIPASPSRPQVGESVAEESLPLFPERGDRPETPENVELIAACA